MTFHWNWHSTIGSVRAENQDYAGIAMHSDLLFAVIADGVFSRPRSGELARDLVSCLIDRATNADHVPTSEDVAQWVQDAFQQLQRAREPKSSTSFNAVCFLREQLLFAVHAGDCRVGVHDSKDGVVWKTPVHSLATAVTPLNEEALRIHPARNQLTRTFTTTRFKQPELTQLNCAYPNGAALVTDGFWAELPFEVQGALDESMCKTKTSCEDDASRLLIRWGTATPLRTTEAVNLYVKIR